MTPVERDVCRRPIEPAEVPHLELLGEWIGYWRRRAGLTQAGVADLLAMSQVHIWRLEAGRRRTRRSTLAELARALADASRRGTDRLDAVQILASFLDAGGPAIAPESARSATSVRRKRKRRTRENLKHDLAVVRAIVDGPDAEPVRGGPEMYLRRRVSAELGRALRSAG